MIGASGAVFGFIGVWQYYDLSFRLKRNESIKPFLGTIFALIIGNIIIAFFLGGGLAWEAHLGGFIVGFIFVPFLRTLKILSFLKVDD
jgi:membrane associated rhomboid family serine protease